MKGKLEEKGQIIVILALGMVAILAITALAVDGSLLYNQRRQDQNTADSAALAGAGAAAQKLRGFRPSEFFLRNRIDIFGSPGIGSGGGRGNKIRFG